MSVMTEKHGRGWTRLLNIPQTQAGVGLELTTWTFAALYSNQIGWQPQTRETQMVCNL